MFSDMLGQNSWREMGRKKDLDPISQNGENLPTDIRTDWKDLITREFHLPEIAFDILMYVLT